MDEYEDNIKRMKAAIRYARLLRAELKQKAADAKRLARELKAKTGKPRRKNR